jgi:TonB family protein
MCNVPFYRVPFLPATSDQTPVLFCENVRLTCRVLCLALGAILPADLSPAASDPVAVAPRDTPRDGDTASAGQITFDIPAQPLASALEAYSITAGREVVYNGNLAIGRQSSSVEGVFTPEAALQELLEGTGLSPRYMAADAFVLAPSVPDPRLVNTAPSVEVASYYGRIQASLKHAFCANSRTQPGNYRVAVSFWIGSSGTVSRAELLGSTGDRDLDATIERTIRSLAVGAGPPQGFAQPVTLMVDPQSPTMTRDCQALRPVGARSP